MRIAEVADRSGFSPATLRYYEQLDLLAAPRRTASGYRAYDESVLARLAFIARAKALGCTLAEIAELLPDWDRGRCDPIQSRLRELVTVKLGDAQGRMAELEAFSADLEGILAGLGPHTPDGPCDSDCGCLADVSSAPRQPAMAQPASEPAACTLDANEVPGRLQDWHDLVSHVIDRSGVDGGSRLQLDAETPLDRLALLVKAEQGCCSFFRFAITVDSRGAALEVRAPAEGLAMVESLFADPT